MNSGGWRAASGTLAAMRILAALVALLAMGCGTRWQPIAASSIKNNDTDLLFVMTDTKAYLLLGSRFEADVVHGLPDQEWARDPNAPFSPQSTDSPEELAERSHWTRVAPHQGDVAIPLRDIRYASSGTPRVRDAAAAVEKTLAVLSVVALVAYLWILDR